MDEKLTVLIAFSIPKAVHNDNLFDVTQKKIRFSRRNVTIFTHQIILGIASTCEENIFYAVQKLYRFHLKQSNFHYSGVNDCLKNIFCRF